MTALNAVTNDTHTMNYYGLDISSIFIDPHDTTGKTVYVTVAGIPSLARKVQTVYRSTDGGAHWTSLTANLPSAPANSLAVDPQDANTVYVATDAGVYSTRQIASCASAPFELLVGLWQRAAGVRRWWSSAPRRPRPACTIWWRRPMGEASGSTRCGRRQNVDDSHCDPVHADLCEPGVRHLQHTQTVTLTNTGTAALTPG